MRLALLTVLHVVRIEMRIRNGLNTREHWAARAKRVAAEKSITRLSLLASKPAIGTKAHLQKQTTSVVFLRLAPRMLDDDNLAGGFKSVRDAVAEYLGVDDGPTSPISWGYAQSVAKEYSVEIQFIGKHNGT